MPEEKYQNDHSFVDESTFQDRDFFWAFSAMWSKKSPERCHANIADTVMVSGGEPQSWMFTAKVRARRSAPAARGRACLGRPTRPLPPCAARCLNCVAVGRMVK